ncbi:hypothetical protein ACFLYS_03295 [Chloroflexota bacterium]
MKSYKYFPMKQYGRKTFFAFFFLVSVLLTAVVFTACGTGSTTTSPPETTTTAITTQATIIPTSSLATPTPTYSEYTIFADLYGEFTITIGSSFDEYYWHVEYEMTKFEQIGESIFSDNQQAEVDPFNRIGSETFTFKALKAGKTQISLVHRPVTDQGSLDYAEMSLWQELFTIIVE